MPAVGEDSDMPLVVASDIGYAYASLTDGFNDVRFFIGLAEFYVIFPAEKLGIGD